MNVRDAFSIIMIWFRMVKAGALQPLRLLQHLSGAQGLGGLRLPGPWHGAPRRLGGGAPRPPPQGIGAPPGRGRRAAAALEGGQKASAQGLDGRGDLAGGAGAAGEEGGRRALRGLHGAVAVGAAAHLGAQRRGGAGHGRCEAHAVAQPAALGRALAGAERGEEPALHRRGLPGAGSALRAAGQLIRSFGRSNILIS